MDHYNSIEASHHTDTTFKTLPDPAAITIATSSLPNPSSTNFLDPQSPSETVSHITNDILPALNGQSRSSRYYGFVIGGILPIAEWADNIVSRVDQNVMVHLPTQSAATAVEDATLGMLSSLINLDEKTWKGRTFTTGATGSNVLGLACARESIVNSKLGKDATVGELGLLKACRLAGVEDFQVLTSMGHSTLSKAASVVGFGRGSVKQLPRSSEKPWELDLEAVEEHLKTEGVASVIAISCGEVNSGRYALRGMEEMRKVRVLADRYGAWIHLDGAFGLFARVLDKTPEFETLHKHVEGAELADSITLDGHKLLNVPYDCGIFFTRSTSTLQSVFTNPNAAYLSATPSSIPSPLNINLENSRRWRALPVYAVLRTLGRSGLSAMLTKLTRFSRDVANFIRESEDYELLPGDDEGRDDEVFMIVMFRAKKKEVNDVLVEKVNETREMYIGGTTWQGEKAARMAVSNWKVEPEKDLPVVKAILGAVAAGKPFDISSVSAS